jgi:hypothetical protein
MAKAFAVAVVALLALSAPAHAKDIERAVVCGVDRCTEIRKPGGAYAGSPGASMPPPGPFYRIELDFGTMVGHPLETVFYVPRARKAASSWQGPGYLWSAPSQTALRVFDRITRGLRPFSRPRFHEVAIDGVVVANPRSYERLLTLRDSGPTRLGEADWQRVEFRTKRANPWSLSTVRYSPGSRILSRSLEWVKVPPPLAAAIEARSSLEASPRDGLDSPLATAALCIALALALATALLVRRSRGLRTAPSVRILPPTG